MYGKVDAVAVIGVRGHPITVEASVGRGLPALCLTGLPGASVQDARERIRPAVESSGLEWPLRRVVVNLSPVGIRKDGPGFDLPVAMSVLVASGQLAAGSTDGYAFAGEVSLKGELMPTPGILAVALAAAARGLRGVVVPIANASEAMLVDGLHVVGAPSLASVVGFANGEWRPEVPNMPEPTDEEVGVADFSEVRGQDRARRAMEVAAAGGHNVLMVGSPGAGKTMLARRMPGILPSMTREEALEVTQLRSVADQLDGGGLAVSRPFRAPHHSVSMAGLLGGGSSLPRPGEVSLAHNGVLFLDEMNEFRRDAIEGLRQPLEDGRVVVTRAGGTVEFPARFTLIAAANPCPCGYRDDPRRGCGCPPNRVQTYAQKLSGPLLDRIDLRVSVPRLSPAELLGQGSGEASVTIRIRVEAARERQRQRYRESGFRSNAELPGNVLRAVTNATREATGLLGRAAERLDLTGRGFDRALRVARTCADLEGSARVEVAHMAEAISYRAGLEDRGPARV
jgi:magnesium chelatase family protein